MANISLKPVGEIHSLKKVDRLRRLYDIVANRGPRKITCKYLDEKLAATPRTILRDIKDLRKRTGIIIRFDRRENTYKCVKAVEDKWKSLIETPHVITLDAEIVVEPPKLFGEDAYLSFSIESISWCVRSFDSGLEKMDIVFKGDRIIRLLQKDLKEMDIKAHERRASAKSSLKITEKYWIEEELDKLHKLITSRMGNEINVYHVFE